MAIAVYFHPNGLTLEQFEEVHRRLSAMGAQPTGRLHHSGVGEDGDMRVYEIWESPEAFEAFGRTLMPVLNEVGVDAGEPSVMSLHRLDQVAHTP
jgi:hypothetical protein